MRREDAPRMARYYFHIHDRFGLLWDEEGTELADLEAVRARAISDARTLMAADMASGRIDLNDYVQVADEAGTVVLTLAYGEAVTVVRPRPR
jgi:hypothetical protein